MPRHLFVFRKRTADTEPNPLLASLLLSRGAATSAIVQTIDNAKSTVLVQAHSFTSNPIIEALVRAHCRGVKVQALLDKSQKSHKHAAVDLLEKADIPTLMDAAHAIAHNKVIIIDDEIVIIGSFNFTKAAEERNAENHLLIRNRELAAHFVDNWHFHETPSVPNNQRRQRD